MIPFPAGDYQPEQVSGLYNGFNCNRVKTSFKNKMADAIR